jgi:hypothetical protein
MALVGQRLSGHRGVLCMPGDVGNDVREFNADYQSGKKAAITSRVAANFVGWDKDRALFDRELARVIRALRTGEDSRENPQSPLNCRVEKMRPSKDKSSLAYNDFLTLDGIPPETFEYRLGNRSALEWVIDQYQVSTDKRSGITNDPNRPDDLEYIVRLLG